MANDKGPPGHDDDPPPTTAFTPSAVELGDLKPIPPEANNPSGQVGSAQSPPPSGNPTDVTGEYASDAEPPQVPTGASTGFPVRAGRYVLRRFHARGGMGEVWLADDSDIGRSIALKRMRWQGSPEQQERFLREARITGQLEHPGIVPVHDLGFDESGQPVYIMKFVQGHTLTQAIREHRAAGADAAPREVRLVRLLQIFVAVCQTVAYAHSRGVLHRDIKPDNIMLGPYGETMLLDWGLARLVGTADGQSGGVSVGASGASHHSQPGSVQGTPGYIPPEMAAGKREQIDQRSDVYLLGATLYQILTGRRPRVGKDVQELIQEALSTPPPAPRTIDPEVPRALEAVCQMAMAYDVTNRYPDAISLAEEVERYLAGESLQAYTERWPVRLLRWARRHRRTLSRVATAGLVAAAATVGVFVVREAWARRAAAEDLARISQLRLEARGRVSIFVGQAAEASYYLVNAAPTTERVPYYEPIRGEQSARRALSLAAELARVPLDDGDREVLTRRRYELLLLLAQSASQKGTEQGARDALSLLDDAEEVFPATVGWHRVRADCYAVLGDERERAARQAALEPGTRRTALDYFLEGERFRVASVQPAKVSKDLPDWQQSRETLNLALNEYRDALRLDPTHYWAHYQTAQCHMALGQPLEGAAVLGTCITLQPDAPWGYLARGVALAQLDRHSLAEDDLNQALKLVPELMPARLTRAMVYWTQQTPEKEQQAIEDLDAVLAAPAETRLVEAAFLRGQIWIQRGKWKEALRDLDRVVTEKPRLRAAHRQRALVLLVLGENARGLEALTGYLAFGKRLEANSPEACEGRGRLLRLIAPQAPADRRAGLLRLALAEFEKATAQAPPSLALLDDHASVLDGLGEYEQAVVLYSQALARAPRDGKILTKRGWAQVNGGKVAAGESDFRAVTGIDATHPEAHTGLGYVAALQKNAPAALRHAHLATLYGGGDYLMLHNVACVHATLATKDAALRREYQDLALDSLRRAVEVWKRVGKPAPGELELIAGESAFDELLRKRPEFAAMIRR